MSVVSTHVNKSICVLTSDEESDITKKLSQFLQAPVNPSNLENYFFQISVNGDRLVVRDQEKRKLEINFDENHLDYQRRGHRGKNELIAKALGVSKGNRKILDLSVGMGIDSVFLSQLGFQVTGVERSSVLFALLQQAFLLSQKTELKNYQLIHADALEFLRTHRGACDIDAIYFDPMYPHKRKSALPKQEMVIFRDLVGSDDDASLVLQEALNWPIKRVVVKRPLQAEELLPGVGHSYEGKVVRYDTYMVG